MATKGLPLMDTLADGRRWLAGLHLRELGEGYGLYLAVDVYTPNDFITPFAYQVCPVGHRCLVPLFSISF